MPTTLTPSLQEAVDALISNLLASATCIRYQRAYLSLNEDHHARDLLEQLSQIQANLRDKQANGATKVEIESLRSLQEQVQRNSFIMDYAHTQQGAITLLREINDEINQLLGINFASFANHTVC